MGSSILKTLLDGKLDKTKAEFDHHENTQAILVFSYLGKG